jgi:hypothetical protein
VLNGGGALGAAASIEQLMANMKREGWFMRLMGKSNADP